MSSPAKRVKIVSDGTACGTVITYGGHPIGMVQKLRIDINTDDNLARCKMEIIVPEIEMELHDEGVSIGTRSFKKCPKCGKWVAPEILHLSGIETPIFKYRCLDCNWGEDIAVPLEWGSVEMAAQAKEMADDAGNT